MTGLQQLRPRVTKFRWADGRDLLSPEISPEHGPLIVHWKASCEELLAAKCSLSTDTWAHDLCLRHGYLSASQSQRSTPLSTYK